MSEEYTSGNRNSQVADLLESIASLLELKAEDPFRVRAYREASQFIAGMAEDIGQIHAQGRLQDIPGVGPSIAAKVAEFLDTGRLRYYEELRGQFAPGLDALLTVPGLGPHRAKAIATQLQVGSLADLARAAREHQLRTLPGFGAKTEENILREVERLQQRTRRMLLSVALSAADELAELLRRSPAVAAVEPAGSIRRRRETIGDIDLVAASDNPEAIMDALVHLPLVTEVLAFGPTKTSVLTRDNLQIDLRVVEPEVYGAALQHFTGSKEHNIALRELAIGKGFKLNEYGLFELAGERRVAGKTEESIYAALGLACMPPELRENRGEIEAAAAGTLPRLVELGDLRGDLHSHTDWSDGVSSLEQMALAARERGYAYLAVTDHSQSLGIAHGLTPERVREQHRAIQGLNERLAPFRLLHGIEIDIRADGSLDYPDDLLAELDLVSASIHSGFGQSLERMTRRIVGAICHPLVDIFNHPTGRLLTRREPYEVDLEAVIAAAAETGTALEIDAQPSRLDLDDVWSRRAKEAGVVLAVDSDAHSVAQLDNLRYGIYTARRGWLEAGDVLNTLPLNELLARLKRNRGRPAPDGSGSKR